MIGRGKEERKGEEERETKKGREEKQKKRSEEEEIKTKGKEERAYLCPVAMFRTNEYR